MADTFNKKKRSEIMKSIKAKGSTLENMPAKRLWQDGYRFSKNVSKLPGKPDIAIMKYKVAIFFDSCFWHGCPDHCRMPKSNTEYWLRKINRNKQRDAEITRHYIEDGWYLLRIWEHQIKENFDKEINKIKKFIDDAKTF